MSKSITPKDSEQLIIPCSVNSHCAIHFHCDRDLFTGLQLNELTFQYVSSAVSPKLNM